MLFLVPQLEVLPMGWNWVLWTCRKVIENSADKAGLDRQLRTQDRKATVPCGVNDVHSSLYVDNVSCISHSPTTVQIDADRLRDVLNQDKLLVHDEITKCTRTTFCGLDFDGQELRIRVSPHRAWNLILAIRFIQTCERIHGSSIEAIVGHLTWCFLARRELLSIFSSIYKFICLHRNETTELWPSVRYELALAASLLPMAYADIDRPWSDVITATDASLAGFGVCELASDSVTTGELGRTAEKWRYETEAIIHARTNALGFDHPKLIHKNTFNDIYQTAFDPDDPEEQTKLRGALTSLSRPQVENCANSQMETSYPDSTR